jgi:hypothetical protein
MPRKQKWGSDACQTREQRGHGPRRGEILETVVDGGLVKAEVEMFHHDKLKVDGLGVWTVEATEI